VRDKKTAHTSRVLRFTVTSVLVMAPLAGCGSGGREFAPNPGPVETYAPNPLPQELEGPVPQGPQLPAGDEADAGVDWGATAAPVPADVLEPPVS
jgi:hypothetical protein